MNTSKQSFPKNKTKEFFSPKATLLSAEQENLLAQDIESVDVHTWTILLGFAPATAWVIESIADSFEGLKKEMAKVQLLSERYILKRDDKSYKKFSKSVLALSKKIRQNDLDRKSLHSLLNKTKSLSTLIVPFTTTVDALESFKKRSLKSYQYAQTLRDQFAEANFGLTVKVAKRYFQSHLELADLVQEGQLGLLKAIDRFDHKRGLRFSTFATWWIRHAIGRSVSDKSRLIRLPVHLIETQQKIKRVQSELTQKLGKKPSNDEIAKTLNIPTSKVVEVLATSARKVESINQPLGKDSDSREYEETLWIPEYANDSFVQDIENKSVFRKIRNMMSYLKPVELSIINKRFGLDGGEGATLQEIANGMALSRERVRQIQNKALDKMRGGLKAELAA